MMKFTISKHDFIKVLQRVQGIVEKRNTMPILANVLLDASGGKVNVMATDLEGFIKESSVFPAVDEGTLEAIDPEALREMIDKTSFAVSTDETRYNINGFLLERDEGRIKMVATDGHRLALVGRNGGNIAKGQKEGVLLPGKGGGE